MFYKMSTLFVEQRSVPLDLEILRFLHCHSHFVDDILELSNSPYSSLNRVTGPRDTLVT